MSDLFDDDDVVIDTDEDLEKIDVDHENVKTIHIKDARIRLEKKLDEKRLRDELDDDFKDY